MESEMTLKEVHEDLEESVIDDTKRVAELLDSYRKDVRRFKDEGLYDTKTMDKALAHITSAELYVSSAIDKLKATKKDLELAMKLYSKSLNNNNEVENDDD
jgi:hypothetical protein